MVTITASVTFMTPPRSVVAASTIAIPTRIRKVPPMRRASGLPPDRTDASGLPRLAGSHRRRSSPLRAQMTAKPMAASTTGQKSVLSNV